MSQELDARTLLGKMLEVREYVGILSDYYTRHIAMVVTNSSLAFVKIIAVAEGDVKFVIIAEVSYEDLVNLSMLKIFTNVRRSFETHFNRPVRNM